MSFQLKVSVTRELIIFLSMILFGMAEGILFDLFKAFLKIKSDNKKLTSFFDFSYWIISTIFFSLYLLYFTYGQMRGYIIIAIILGLIFYFLLLSKSVSYIFGFIINFFLKSFRIFFKILLTPLTFLYRIIVKCFIVIKNKVEYFLKLKLRIEK